MPEIKDYDGKKTKKTTPRMTAKRRPHHEINDDAINTEALNEGVAAGVADEAAADFAETASTSDDFATNESAYEPNSFNSNSTEEEKVRLEFYGSEILRAKAPKAMEIADIVADEWVKDGQFQGLPLGNPVAQVAASMALRKAKDVEKKLEEKGVFTMAKMGLDYVKSKIEKKS